MAVFDIGQKGHFFMKKGHLFEKKAPRILPSPYSIPFLSVLHQNKALYSFHKRGQRSQTQMQYTSRICPALGEV